MLTIDAVNTFTGDVDIQGGTLRHGQADSLVDSTVVSIANGATWDLNGFDDTVSSFNGLGDIALGSATLSAFNDNSSITFAGNITGAGGDFSKLGTGTLTLTGNLSYTGSTTVAGELVIQDDSAAVATSGFFGTGRVVIEPASASFSTSVDTGSITFANTLTGLRIGKDGNTAAVTIGGPTAIAGDVSLYGGNVTINDAVDTSSTNGGDVLLKATSMIFANSSGVITTDDGDVTLWADSDADSAGAIIFSGTVSTGGGDIVMGGGTDPAADDAIGTSFYNNGVSLSGTTLDAGGGNILLRGTGNQTQANNARGVYLSNNASVSTTGSGTITVNGTGGPLGSSNSGLRVQSGATITGGSTGAVTVNAVGGGSTSGNSGLWIDGSGSAISSAGGNISVTGVGGSGTSGSNRGVQLSNGGQINATGDGTVYVHGTGMGNGGGTGANQGTKPVWHQQSALRRRTATSPLSVLPAIQHSSRNGGSTSTHSRKSEVMPRSLSQEPVAPMAALRLA